MAFSLDLKKIYSKEVILNNHEIKNKFKNMTYVCEFFGTAPTLVWRQNNLTAIYPGCPQQGAYENYE